jgi:tetratricopeptide (TPR) repeat protein
MYTVLFRVHVDRKDWPAALAAIEKGEPNGADLLKLAQVHSFTGNQAKADSTYLALVEKDSTSADAKFGLQELGKARYRVKNYPEAISILSRRIALDPNSHEAYYFRGLSYKEMKQFPEAIADFGQAINLQPTKGDYHFWKAVTLSQSGSVDQAMESFRAMVAVDTSSKNASVAYQQLGYRPLIKKEWNTAIDYLEKSVAIDPKNVQSLVWLAQAYQNAGNREKAVSYYRKALEVQPGEPNATKGLKTLGV